MNASGPTFHHPDAELFVPDGSAPAGALARTTHLGVGAHPDDLEFMAYEGIASCYDSDALFFGGVTATAGANPPKAGRYADISPQAMARLRRDEQMTAARLGQYSFQACLGYASEDLKTRADDVRDDLLRILEGASPEVVYLHNPLDRHPTHVALFRRSLEALRRLPTPPRQVWGCEVWRGLEWLSGQHRHALSTQAQPQLARQLHHVFVSQNEGGKRYDLAVPARWQANATFADARATDALAQLSWAVDLTPLVAEPSAEVEDYLRMLVSAVLHEQTELWRSAAA